MTTLLVSRHLVILCVCVGVIQSSAGRHFQILNIKATFLKLMDIISVFAVDRVIFCHDLLMLWSCLFKWNSLESWSHIYNFISEVWYVCTFDSVWGTLQRSPQLSSQQGSAASCCEQRTRRRLYLCVCMCVCARACVGVCVTAHITLYPQGWLLPSLYSLTIHLYLCVCVSVCMRVRTDAIIILT